MAILRRANAGKPKGRGGGGKQRGRGGGGPRRGRGPVGPFRLQKQICAYGGRCGRLSLPMETKDIPTAGGGMDTFVKVEMSQPWLTKAVTGKVHPYKGTTPIKLCPMYSMIRNAMAESLAPAEAAVAASTEMREDDPMALMDIVALDTVGKKVAKERSQSAQWKCNRRKVVKKLSNQVMELQIPEHSTLEKRRGGGRRTITIYATTSDARCFWLRTDHVEWLVEVMCREFDLRGVEVLDEPEVVSSGQAVGQQAQSADPGEPSLANGSGASSSSSDAAPAQNAAPAPHLQPVKVSWNFQVDCWEASFCVAPTTTPEKMYCRARDLTPAKVAQIGMNNLDSMTPDQKKKAAKQYLIHKVTERMTPEAQRRPVARPLVSTNDS